jgi:hypothetical protein
MSDPIGYDQQFVIPYYMVTGTNKMGKKFAAFTRAIPRRYLVEKPVPTIKVPPALRNKKKP